jgi:hypothetical protein
MAKKRNIFKVVLLIGLALCVGGPPSVAALERTPQLAIDSNDQPGQPPPQLQSIGNNGDPDDWASKTEGEGEEDEISAGTVQFLLGGPGATWRDRAERFGGRLICIKVYLTGIL